jgi:hypothetical protein
MPKFVNTADHPVRVADESGALRRVVPGQVVEADGKFADNLKGTNGIESAKKEHEDAYAERQAARTGASRDRAILEQATEARAAARSLASADAQVVRGDDQAPHGPGTGTITTKQALAEEGEGEAFAQGEAINIGEVAEGEDVAGRPNGGKVHNQQLAREQATGETASALAALAEDGEPTDANRSGDDGDK